MRYYAVALRSTREHAPSLLPVLVVLNAMPPDFINWVEAQARHTDCACAGLLERRHGRARVRRLLAFQQHNPFPFPCLQSQGVLVVPHNVSFAGRMLANTRDPRLRRLHPNLMASFARLDIPAIMEQVGWVAGLGLGGSRAAPPGLQPSASG